MLSNAPETGQKKRPPFWQKYRAIISLHGFVFKQLFSELQFLPLTGLNSGIIHRVHLISTSATQKVFFWFLYIQGVRVQPQFPHCRRYRRWSFLLTLLGRVIRTGMTTETRNLCILPILGGKCCPTIKWLYTDQDYEFEWADLLPRMISVGSFSRMIRSQPHFLFFTQRTMQGHSKE